MPKDPITGLTPKQERFCQEYMTDLDGVKAAMRSGYARTTAIAKSSKWLEKVKFKTRIGNLQSSLAVKTGVTQERVIDEYIKIGFANTKDFIGEDNTIKDLSTLPRDLTAAVESIQSETRHDNGDSEGYTDKVKVKFYNKLNALNDLGRHLGLFERDNKQKVLPLLEIYEDICHNNKAITISPDQS